MTAGFGARLRMQRERKGIGLDAIAQSTKISLGLFEALERDDASRWPSGLFRRAFIRAYANAIGLDPESTVSEFLRHFPDPADEPRTPAPETRSGADLRLTFADESRTLTVASVDALLPIRRRACAATYDAIFVLTIALLAFAVAGVFWAPFTVAAVCYYFGGVLTFGNSPGAWLIARGSRRPRRQPRVAATPPPATAALADAADHLRTLTTRHHPRAV